MKLSGKCKIWEINLGWVWWRWQPEWGGWSRSVAGVIWCCFRLGIPRAVRTWCLQLRFSYEKNPRTIWETWSWLDVMLLGARAGCGASPKSISKFIWGPIQIMSWKISCNLAIRTDSLRLLCHVPRRCCVSGRSLFPHCSVTIIYILYFCSFLIKIVTWGRSNVGFFLEASWEELACFLQWGLK